MSEVIDNISLYLEFIIALGGAVAVLIGAVRFSNRRLEEKIVEEIKKATEPIHPDSNGGKSLADVHVKLDEAIHKIDNRLLFLEAYVRGRQEGDDDQTR